MKRFGICLLVMWAVAFGQEPQESDVLPLGGRVHAPRLIRKAEPVYSEAARQAHIEGTVLLQIVVSEKGAPKDIEVLRPLGFGIDEKAIEAVSQWRFEPGTKDGQPVNVLAQVEVSFRLLGQGFDKKTAQRKTQFNEIVTRLAQDPSAKPTDEDVAVMQDLANHKLAVARYVLGKWQRAGFGVPKDEAAGLTNIQKAAEQNFAPAMDFIGRAEMEGDGVPKDPVNGLAMVKEAALFGSLDAEFFLGESYAHGTGVGEDAEQAKYYFRLCGAGGMAACQFRVGQLLMGGGAARKESDLVQGIAWWELAEGHGYEPAKGLGAGEEAKLTAEQRDGVKRLRAELERK